MANVVILLATYNGSRFICEMIDSILSQDYTDWELVLSDDGSRDNTVSILENYARKFQDRIHLYRSGMHFGNAQDHFMHLLERFHEAPYIMFCDQDDVWHKDKITKTLAKMHEIETDASIPVMVHTDLCVVNDTLGIIDDSFMHFSKLDGNRLDLKKLLVQNVVTGCTVMVNRSLAVLACKHIPQSGILMHDWWLALLASACGVIGFLNEATIDYRQHEGNTVGAKNTRSLFYMFSRLKDSSKTMQQTFIQAKMLYECFGSEMKPDVSEIVSTYGSLMDKNGFIRKTTYLWRGYLKIGAIRVLSQLVFG